MTTTLERHDSLAPEHRDTLVLEPVELKDMPPLKTTRPTPAPKKGSLLPKFMAVGLLAGLAGLAAGVGLGTWMASDEITGLEAQQGLMLTVPYGGFQSGYSAVREHQAYMNWPKVETWSVPVRPYQVTYEHEHQALIDVQEVTLTPVPVRPAGTT